MVLWSGKPLGSGAPTAMTPRDPGPRAQQLHRCASHPPPQGALFSVGPPMGSGKVSPRSSRADISEKVISSSGTMAGAQEVVSQDVCCHQPPGKLPRGDSGRGMGGGDPVPSSGLHHLTWHLLTHGAWGPRGKKLTLNKTRLMTWGARQGLGTGGLTRPRGLWPTPGRKASRAWSVLPDAARSPLGHCVELTSGGTCDHGQPCRRTWDIKAQAGAVLSPGAAGGVPGRDSRSPARPLGPPGASSLH